MPQFNKGDRVRAKATLFDGGEGTRDRNGLLFSEKWAADGHGEWFMGQLLLFMLGEEDTHSCTE
jgi:hypothetical protein